MSRLAFPSNWEIQKNDVKLEEEIGRGAFGVVFKGTYHSMEVAVKKIASSADSEDRLKAANLLNNEIKTLGQCQHENIVRLLGACTRPPMLIMALAKNGTLRDLLDDESQTLTHADKLHILSGICNGMAMAHSKGILHLDLKPTNVLMNGLI